MPRCSLMPAVMMYIFVCTFFQDTDATVLPDASCNNVCTFFFGYRCHGAPRGLKKSHGKGTINRQTDIATTRPNWPSGPIRSKSRIRETQNISTKVDSRTNTFVSAGVKKGSGLWCLFMLYALFNFFYSVKIIKPKISTAWKQQSCSPITLPTALADKSSDMFDLCGNIAAIGMERGAAMHLYSFFPQHNTPMHSQNLHAQALIMPKISTMSSDLSASANPLIIFISSW